MENVKRKVRQYLTEQRKMSRWHKVVTGLAGVVVFCTTYALILPAITLTTPLECGLEEHVHTDECYTVETAAAERELLCGLEEAEPHIHDGSCYTEQAHYTCGQEETEGHSHSGECYERTRELTCTQEDETVEKQMEKQAAKEVEKQVPRETTDENGETVIEYDAVTETEYETVLETVTETIPHTHTDSCYTWSEELVCGQEEGGGHTHSEACEETGEVLTCGKEETEGHTHTDACWLIPENKGETGEVRTLTCGKEEHTHTDACYLDIELEEGPGYYCGFDIEHTHDSNCYFEDGVLKCTISEHVHTDECLVDLEEQIMLLAEGDAYPEIGITDSKIGTVTLTYLNGQVVDTSTALDPDQRYLLNLAIDSVDGLQPNTHYVYQLPEGVDVGEQYMTTKIPLQMSDANSTVIGQWWVDGNGKVIVETNENAADFQNMTLIASMDISFDKSVENIDFDGGIHVNIKKEEESSLTVYKWDENRNTDSCSMKWEVQIISHDGTPIVGSTIKDEWTGSYPGQYAYRYTEEDMAKGIRVYPYFGNYNDYMNHWFTIPAEDITWTENGWSFMMPDGELTCEAHGEKALMEKASAFQLEYYSTIPANAEGIVGNGNKVTVTPKDDPERSATGSTWSEHHFTGEGKSTIEKTSVYNAETDTISWTIKATVYANPENGDIPNVYIVDQMDVVDSKDQIITADGKGNPIANLNLQDLSELNIQATINGTTYKVPCIDMKAPDADKKIREMAERGDPLACVGEVVSGGITGGTQNDSWRLGFWNLCKCKEDHCHDWDGTKCKNVVYGYCMCWGFEEAVELTITYDTYVGDVERVNENGETERVPGLRSSYAGNSLANMARLGEIYKVGPKYMDSITYERLKSSFAKSLTEIPQAGNNYTAEFNITVNENKKDLSGQDRIEILDQMSENLVFMPQTLVVRSEDSEGGSQTLKLDTDYTVSYDEDKHLLTIRLLEPGAYMYTLDYDAAVVLTNGATFQYSNTATVTLNGVHYESAVEPTESAITTVYGKSYQISLRKDNINGVALSGAVFGLYARNGNLITTVTTDENGKAELKTNTSKGVMFYEHTPYYIQEITAPAGYKLADDKFWFMFCGGKEGESCGECGKLQEEIGEEIVREFGGSGSMTIVNYGMYTLPDTGGNGLTPWYTMAALLFTAAAYLMYRSQQCVRRKEDAM